MTISSNFPQSSKCSLKLRFSVQQKNYPVPNLDSQILFKLVSSWAHVRQTVTPPGNSTSEHPPATDPPTLLPGIQPALKTAPTQAPCSSLRNFDACQYSQPRKFSVKIIFIKKEAKSAKKKNLQEKNSFHSSTLYFPFKHSEMKKFSSLVWNYLLSWHFGTVFFIIIVTDKLRGWNQHETFWNLQLKSLSCPKMKLLFLNFWSANSLGINILCPSVKH